MNRRQMILAAATAGLAPSVALAAAPTRFSVKVEGKGPDVILIPGLVSSAQVWDDTVKHISATHRTHTIQVAGFAGAPAAGNAQGEVLPPLVEEIAAYMADQNLQKPAVIGHSVGGLIGLMLVAAHPQAVGRLLVVDSLPFYGMLFGPMATVALVKPQAAMMRDNIVAMSAEAFAAQQTQGVGNLVKTPSARETVLAWSLVSDRSVAGRVMYEDMTTDVRPTLAAIAVPVTVLYAYDPQMGQPAAMVDAMYQAAYGALPNKTLARIDGSFHFIMYDQPQLFAQKVDAFLA